MKLIDQDTLLSVTGKILGTKIIRADYRTRQLHGGTLGDVKLVMGTAATQEGLELPYRAVWKTQRKWERYKDPDSWRREYDLYLSALGTAFSDSLRWPKCYLARINGDETEIQLWMEYIDGISGLDLTAGMYERAALELGRFQGRLYAVQPAFLREITNLSGVDYLKNFYRHYRSWKRVYDAIRSESCGIPKHLCGMLINIDDDADCIFSRIEKLPVVLCHRDFWVANIFCSGDAIRPIDWDTTGWGYLGEDIASLIADEANLPLMPELYQSCITAYYNGFREYADISPIADHCVWEMMLLMYGYRYVEYYLDAKSENDRQLQVDTLQKIYEMRN
jgi:hypothetical protein